LNATRYLLWLALPVQAGLMTLGQSFLRLWMKHDPSIAEHSYVPLLILAMPLVLIPAQMVAARILYGMGQLRWFARAALAEAGVNLVLSLALVSHLGIVGVALAIAVPNLLGSAALLIYISRTLGLRLTAYLRYAFLAPFVAALLLGAGWLVSTLGSTLISWPALIATATVGLAGYGSVGLLVEVGPRKLWSFLKVYGFWAWERRPNAKAALAAGTPFREKEASPDGEQALPSAWQMAETR
jgi:O-antigen/teichoic acid export membrane protein